MKRKGHPSAETSGIPGGHFGLIQGTPAKPTLTKAQQAFQRLVRKIERLRRDVDVETERLNGCLVTYSTELHPVEVRIVAHRKIIVRRLYVFLTSRQIPGRRQREALRAEICGQFAEILDLEGALKEPDLQAIWDELEKADRQELDAEDVERLEQFRRRAEEDFRERGIEVDLSKFHPGMSNEEFLEAMEEVGARVREAEASRGAAGESSSGRKGPAREGRREQRERLEQELRQRDLASLYKQLAKRLHPDLEPDPVVRLEKEAAMKRLTTAYKDRDLHALLGLELEWICREQVDVARLADEKLRVYNGILKEQVAELEERIRDMARHPRFAPLLRHAHPLFGPGIFDFQWARERLRGILAATERLAEGLDGPEGLRTVRVHLRSLRRSPGPLPGFWD